MTFAEFRATRVDCGRAKMEQLKYPLPDNYTPMTGYCYIDQLIIECTESWPITGDLCKYFLAIENTHRASDDLEELERALYAYAIKAGYLEGTDAVS